MERKESVQIKFGFQLDAITTDFIKNVAVIYGESVGMTQSVERFVQQVELAGVDDIKDELTGNGYCERRLGSSLDFNSKLVIKRSREGLYFVKFNPNLDLNEDDEFKKIKANSMAGEFESKISRFLLDSGLGKELRS